jgi:hypothetical protein
MAWVYSSRVSPLSAKERWPAKRELDDQHAADLSGGTIHHILLHAVDPRVWEQRDIEIGRFLGLILEPQAWRYLGHDFFSVEHAAAVRVR